MLILLRKILTFFISCDKAALWMVQSVRPYHWKINCCVGRLTVLLEDKLYYWQINCDVGRSGIFSEDAVISVLFLRRPIGPRPATLLSGLQLQKHVGPADRQLLYLLFWSDSSATVKGYWYNKILLKRYTFSYDPFHHQRQMSKLYQWNSRYQNCFDRTRDVTVLSTIPTKEIQVFS